jgi:hypothetical protein
LNETLTKEALHVGEVIVKGIEKAKLNGVKYYSRGFTITERDFKLESSDIPFTQLEQIIVNSLEDEFFSGLVPGDAKKGRFLLEGFTLVNCRIFSRALTLALSNPTGDPMAILALLNDMRPTMLELDSNWTNLLKKYPTAGVEPTIPDSITAEDVKSVILDKLLANPDDIKNFENEIQKKADLTGWRNAGWEHISIFEEEGLERAANLIKHIMVSIKDNEPANKFTLFDPIEELF